MSDEKKGGSTPPLEKVEKSLSTSHQTGTMNQSGQGQGGQGSGANGSSGGGSSNQGKGGGKEGGKS